MSQKKAENDWMSVSEAAQKLGMHINTLKKLPPEELPYFRVTARGDRKYRIEDVEGYIESRMVYTKDGAWAR